MKIRIGHGFDVHQLKLGRPLWIGGILLEHNKGLDGHSDADVLIHAICDAILGAAGLKDIGFYFPNTKSEIAGIDSKIILAQTIALIKKEGWRIENIDSTLVMEQPKINPHIDAMKAKLSPILDVPISCIGIKATTNESLGFIGREEGAAAYAVALLISN